jgi:hypothetical protein
MISRLFRSACLLPLLASVAGPAPAAPRTFVASYGNDVNPCSVAAPCRSFAAAIALTNATGEVIVLDSAGYGPVTIAKSVSLIAAPGVYAGISVFSGIGITIGAGATDRIVLRGLAINGQGGSIGIAVGTSGQVHVESCVISGMGNQGILATLGSYVRVANTTIRSNGQDGIFFTGAGTLAIEDTSIVRNTRHGVWINDAAKAMIRGLRSGDNVFEGLFVAQGTGTGTVTVSDSDFSGNGRIGVKLWAIPSVGSPFLGVSMNNVSSNRNFANGIEIIGNSPGNINATINDSQLTFNGSYGVASSGSGIALVTVNRSAVNDNGAVGVYAAGSASVIVALNNNNIARNAVNDIERISPAIVRTFQNNALTGNGSDVSGSIANVSPH